MQGKWFGGVGGLSWEMKTRKKEILFSDRPLRRYLAIQLSEKNYC